MSPQRETELRADLREIEEALAGNEPTPEERQQLERLAADIRRWLSPEDRQLTRQFEKAMADGASAWNKPL